jgi:hypothetical protein
MKTYGGGETEVHTFLISALEGGEWSASCPSRITHYSYHEIYQVYYKSKPPEMFFFLIYHTTATTTENPVAILCDITLPNI